MPKENMYYTCIACITIDSVVNFDKKNHPQVYLEECKDSIKKTQIPKFIKNWIKIRFTFRFRSGVKTWC